MHCMHWCCTALRAELRHDQLVKASIVDALRSVLLGGDEIVHSGDEVVQAAQWRWNRS